MRGLHVPYHALARPSRSPSIPLIASREYSRPWVGPCLCVLLSVLVLPSLYLSFKKGAARHQHNPTHNPTPKAPNAPTGTTSGLSVSGIPKGDRRGSEGSGQRRERSAEAPSGSRPGQRPSAPRPAPCKPRATRPRPARMAAMPSPRPALARPMLSLGRRPPPAPKVGLRQPASGVR
jgi:hypothetical protein